MGRITKPPPGAQVDWGNPINDGLEAWWPFYEGAGPRLTDIVAQNRGVLTNMDPATAWVGSLHGGTLGFDGNNDFVDAGDEINLVDSSLTVSIWAKREDIGRDQWLLSSGDAVGTNGKVLHLGFRGTDEFAFSFWGNDLNTVTQYTDRDWHHWVGTYVAASNDRRIYVDGRFEIGQTTAFDFSGQGDTIIATLPQSGGNRRFGGLIDDLQIYNRALSSLEVQQLFRFPYGGILARAIRFAPAAVAVPDVDEWFRQHPDNLHPEQLKERRSFFFLGLPNDIHERVVLPDWHRDKDPERPHPETLTERRSQVTMGLPNDIRERIVLPHWFREKDPERPHLETLRERRSEFVLGVPNDIREQIELSDWFSDKAPERRHAATLTERRSEIVLALPNDLRESVLLSQWAIESPDRLRQPLSTDDWFALVELVTAAPVLLDFLPIVTDLVQQPRTPQDWAAFVQLVAAAPAVDLIDFLPVLRELSRSPRFDRDWFALVERVFQLPKGEGKLLLGPQRPFMAGPPSKTIRGPAC